eukprot:3273934-Alexandrium_andersonii.AAC.1
MASRISKASDCVTPLTMAIMSSRSAAPCWRQARSHCRRTRSRSSVSSRKRSTRDSSQATDP